MIPLTVQTWLVDTLVWTGVLLALALVLRKPVARMFGPNLAYALWLLPVLRMVVPTVTVPVPQAMAPAAAPLVLPVLAGVPHAAIEAVPVQPAFDWAGPLVALWLAGAAVFLAWRFASYHRMRRRVLEAGVEAGRIGKVRLVESAEVSVPVAFGLIDKVVALPTGFLDSEDRLGRILAVRHELQHHDGGDVLFNMAVQPLFALHWFNPLAWLAWRALRRDQEAACDARVVAGYEAPVREAYARLIAGFAAGSHLRRPVPLACPVAGEKSIIHRLRSLTMSQPSRRRRLAGRTLVAAGALALPLTATITYAASQAPEPPAPPAAPDAPTPPAPPQAPAAPAAPEPPAAPHAVKHIVMIDKTDDGQPGKHKIYTREVDRNGKSYVIKTDHPMSDAEFQKKMEELGKRMEEAGRKAGEAAAKAAQAQVDAQQIRQQALATAAASMGCKAGEGGYDFTTSADDGGKHAEIALRICAMNKALDGIRTARDRIAADPNMDAGIKQDVLRSLDAEIEKLSKRKG